MLYKGSSLSDVTVKLYIISMFVILNFTTYDVKKLLLVISTFHPFFRVLW